MLNYCVCDPAMPLGEKIYTSTSPHRLPGKGRPINVKIVTSGSNIKLDLVEIVQVVYDLWGEAWVKEGAPGVVPVTRDDKIPQVNKEVGDRRHITWLESGSSCHF